MLETIREYVVTNLLALSGWLIGLVALIWGIFTYYKSKREKKLSYMVRNFNLIHDKISSVEGLSISFKGSEVSTFSVAKFCIWNSGTETISDSDIAKSNRLRIVAAQGVKILDLKLLQYTNDSNDIVLQAHPNNESISIEFDYLDSLDGVLLQITHTGTIGNDLSMIGSVKGIKELTRTYEYSWTADDNVIFTRRPTTIFNFIVFLFVLLSPIVGLLYIYYLNRSKVFSNSGFIPIMSILICILVSYLLVAIVKMMKRKFPKGLSEMFKDS